MFRLACLLIATSIVAGASFAQVPAPPGAPSGDSPAAAEKPGKKKIENKANKKKDEDAKASAAASSTDDIVPLPGDSVYFKTGRVLKGVTVVINAAATTQLQGENDTAAVDREGTRNLVDAAKRAGVKRIVFITGMSVYSPPPQMPPPMLKAFGDKREAEIGRAHV